MADSSASADPEARWCKSRRYGALALLIVVAFGFRGWDVTDRTDRLPVVVRFEPAQGCELQLYVAAPGASTHDVGFVPPVDRFGGGIVVAVTGAADGRFDARVGKAPGVADRLVLRATIATDLFRATRRFSLMPKADHETEAADLLPAGAIEEPQEIR